MEQNVFFYPEPDNESSSVAQTQEKVSESDLLEIMDLVKTASEHNKEDMALLNQLTILPSETAISHKAVANDLTCKLCSTIIYRPLKDDKKL